MTVLDTTLTVEPFNIRTGWIELRQLPAIDPASLEGTTLRASLGEGQLTIALDGHAATVLFESPDYSMSYVADDVDLVQARPDIRYLDLVDTAEARSVTLIINDKGAVLAVFNDVKDQHGVPSIGQRVYSGILDTAHPGTVPFERSADLIGKRAIVSYQDDHVLEHFYINSDHIAWQLLQGEAGKGHAEISRGTTWKIAEDLYLLAWVEPPRPIVVVLLMDYAARLNTGKVMGVDQTGFTNERAGARIDYLGDKPWYPEGNAPE